MDLNISYTRASESLPPGTQTPECTGADEVRGLAGETQDARTTCQPCTKPLPLLALPQPPNRATGCDSRAEWSTGHSSASPRVVEPAAVPSGEPR